jgi:hypothetical protein
MLSTLALLGGVAGGLGAMAVYTLGKNPFIPGTVSAAHKHPLPQEEPNLVDVEYPYIHQWTEIRPDVLVEAYVGSKIEKVLVRAGFYMEGEPYKDFVTKTYPKSGSKEGTITKTIPYIAYEQIWVPPVYKGVVKDIYDYRPMEIIHEETRWREIAVDAGCLTIEEARDFFKNMDPRLQFWEMEQLFEVRKREKMLEVIANDTEATSDELDYALVEISRSLAEFGITLDNFSSVDKISAFKNAFSLYEAVLAVSGELSRVSGSSQTDIFHTAFGPMKVSIQPKQPWDVWAYDGRITIETGTISTRRRFIHELAHCFSFHQIITTRSSHNPITKLAEGIYCEYEGKRELVTISGDRHGRKYWSDRGDLKNSIAPRNGFTADNYQEPLESQWHPYGEGGNIPGEDWADIFMNWVDNSFEKTNPRGNAAGEALYKWVEENMPEWLSTYNGVEGD